jgi:hypothetical protein
LEDDAMKVVQEFPTLRLWLAAQELPRLVEVLAAVGDELSSRQQFDARNYITRAVACLDAERITFAERQAPAESPSSV